MNRTMSRRTVLGLAGAGALSLTGLRALPARAQDIASPYTFPNGKVLTWADPWGVGGLNGNGYFPGASYVNLAVPATKAGLVVGYFDAPTTIDDLTKTVLTTLWGDPALAQNVGGGGGQKVGAGGKVESESAYSVHTMTTPDGIVWGLYVELINKTDYTLLVTPVPDFAASVTSAQTAVAVDGVGVLGGVDGAKIQQTMEPSPGAAAATTDGAAAGGQYTIPSGNIDVVWPAGWTVAGQSDAHIQLTNASQIMTLLIQGVPFNGETWDQAAAADQGTFFDDQGASATISGPVVTESGYMLTTDGEYGPRMINAFASSDPLVFVFVLAAHIQPGADLTALAAEANGVTANGVPVLQGIEAVIPPAA